MQAPLVVGVLGWPRAGCVGVDPVLDPKREVWRRAMMSDLFEHAGRGYDASFLDDGRAVERLGGTFVTDPDGLIDVKEPFVPTNSAADGFEFYERLDPFPVAHRSTRHRQTPFVGAQHLEQPGAHRKARPPKIKDRQDTPVVHLEEVVDVLRPAAMVRDMGVKNVEVWGVAVNKEFFDQTDEGIHHNTFKIRQQTTPTDLGVNL